MTMTPAIFLDRDGVINENRADHVTAWDDFAPVPGALTGLRMLAALGLPVVIVTNQGIVGRGEITVAELDALHARMRNLVSRHGGRITQVYVCPHNAQDRCDCRKPAPGMFHRAAGEHNIDLAASYYVGDALTDVAAGQAAGCTTVLVRSGRGLTQLLRQQAQAYSGYYVARDLSHAARFIAHDRARRIGRPSLVSTMRLAVNSVQFV
jgi:D-glycero-D-manno-heptose 1,7-bisphosphate phosphatase